MKTTLPLLLILLGSCSRVGEAIGSGAELAGKTAGKLAQRMGSGVEQALEIKPTLSPRVTESGLQMGKVLTGQDGEGTDNKLSVYFIAGKTVKTSVLARVLDAQNKEIGRAVSEILLDSGQARYFDFVFDERTNIDGDSKVYLDIN